MTDHDLHDPDFDPVVQRLRTERPLLTAIELDDVKRRVRSRVASGPARRRTRSQFMKSRMAILSMLVAGMLLSTTGAGLAVSGLSGSSSAGIAEYGSDHKGPDKGGAVLGGDDSDSPSGEAEANDNAAAPLQPTRQVEVGVGGESSGELPFTGFVAIPVLLGGIALLSVGLVLRRRSRDDAA
jgi:hypothetical protein